MHRHVGQLGQHTSGLEDGCQLLLLWGLGDECLQVLHGAGGAELGVGDEVAGELVETLADLGFVSFVLDIENGAVGYARRI